MGGNETQLKKVIDKARFLASIAESKDALRKPPSREILRDHILFLLFLRDSLRLMMLLKVLFSYLLIIIARFFVQSTFISLKFRLGI